MLGTRGESSSLPATPSPLRPINPTSLLFLVWGGKGMSFALSVGGHIFYFLLAVARE